MPVQRPVLALGLRFASVALVSVMFMLGKLAAESGVHLLEIMFWRQFAAWPVLMLYLVTVGGLSRVATRRLGGHALRAMFGLAGVFLSFAAAILLPLPEATTFGFTAPIFAVLLGTLFYRQPAGLWRTVAIILGFLGIIIIARPGGNAVPLLGVAAAIGASLTVALVSYQLRNLGRTESPLAVVFWFSTTTSPLLMLAMPFVMQQHDWYQLALLAGIGMAGTAAQFLMAAALRVGQVTSVIVMDYSALIWAILYGWLIWDQLPAESTWMGLPLIVAAGLIVVWNEHRVARAIMKPAAETAS